MLTEKETWWDQEGSRNRVQERSKVLAWFQYNQSSALGKKTYLPSHQWSSQAWLLISQRTQHESQPVWRRKQIYEQVHDPQKRHRTPDKALWNLTSFSLSVRTLISSSYLSSFCEYCGTKTKTGVKHMGMGSNSHTHTHILVHLSKQIL